MEKIIEIIKQRILLAEKRMAEVTTREEYAFWDGQMRCAQALLNEAHLTLRALDGGEVLPPHNHIYVDGYCACGHAVERHRH